MASTLTQSVRRHTPAVSLLAFALSGCAEPAPDPGREAGENTATASAGVVGGSDATPGEYPWQAQLATPFADHYCGGSIVDRDWVLTAAHCTTGLAAGNLTVRAGLHRRSAPDGNVQTRAVRRIVRHPAYNPATLENDVALLELTSPFTYQPSVQPIAIRPTDPPVGAVAAVSGWGQTAPGSASADVLQEALLPVQSTATCNNAGTLPLTVRDASMVCAGYVGGESGGCHGDSGGPLVVPRDSFSGGWEQVGVVSWGVGGSCSSFTVFARLSAFASWVAAQTGPVDFYGDVDASGCVDAADEASIVANFGRAAPPGDPLDLNGDGVINIFDRMIVLQNFGDGCP